MNCGVEWILLNAFMQDFDPIKHILERVPADENELTYFEKQVWFMCLNLANR